MCIFFGSIFLSIYFDPFRCCSFRMSASFEQEMHTNNNQCGSPLNFRYKGIKYRKEDFKCTDFYQSRRICGAHK